MRRIVTFNNVSADGYFAGIDGGLDWVVPDPDLSKSVMEAGRVDTGLFGRVTYQQFESFWPHAAEDPATPPELRVFADALNKMTKVVFSRTLKRVTWKNSKLLREIVPEEIERMKEEPGEDIIIFGSASVAEKLTDHGLIDEYQFIVNPVLLGRGKSLLSDSKFRTNLELEQAKPFKSGNVFLSYASKKRGATASPGPHSHLAKRLT